MRTISGMAALGLLLTIGCSGGAENVEQEGAEASPADGPSAAQAVFWDGLQALCGQAFAGRVIETPATDDPEPLRMHVRECDDDEIRIPFLVGDDRSRTWVVTRTATGLRLKHDHRLPDGSPDLSNTRYGGDTAEAGSEWRQEFPADAYSIEAVPDRASQHWYLELQPGEAFVYGLLREATGLRYRYAFDLTEPIAEPAPPWGHDRPGW